MTILIPPDAGRTDLEKPLALALDCRFPAGHSISNSVTPIMRTSSGILAALSLTLIVTGCASSTTSNTARTAKEQMLLSSAVEKSLGKIDFSPLNGQQVYVEERYLECVDKPFVVGSIRHQVMRSGGRLVVDADAADVVMELRSGGVGTDTSEAFLGTPEIALPGILTIPEIRLAERKTQYGYAKLGLVLYDAKNLQVLGNGGMSLAQSDDNNWFFFGAGPFQDGSIEQDVATAQQPGRSTSNGPIPTIVAFGTRNQQSKDAPDIQFASGRSSE